MSGSSTTYGYNQAKQLISYAKGSISASYSYDGDGLRAGNTVSEVTEGYVWDLAEGMPTIIEDGGTTYITGPGGLPIEQVDGSGATAYSLRDQLGSTRGLTDSSGQVVERATYDAYGNVRGESGSVSTPFGYAGQYTDSESGLQYLRARYYDPSTEQFLTVDPVSAATQQPYSYAGSNPTSAIDPLGLDPQSACGCSDSGGGLMGFHFPTWVSHNGKWVTLAVGLAAALLAGLGPESLAFAAVVGVIASFLQVLIDLSNHDYFAAAVDVVGLLFGVASAKAGWDALRYLWSIRDVVGMLKDAILAGEAESAGWLLARALNLQEVMKLVEGRGVRWDAGGFMSGVFAAVGNGSECG
jgi:RHS repeat-associated protein